MPIMEDKFVINIGRQLGSGGKAVGEAIAQRLGIGVYDKQLINLAAEQSALFKIQSDVIRDIAARESCVFVGRCADYILRDHPRAVNVFVAADRADRCERLCRQCGITPGEAEARMDREDARRAAYYNYYSSGTWGMASTYHLCVDSSVLGIDGTVDFVLEFVERKLGVKPGAI